MQGVSEKLRGGERERERGGWERGRERGCGGGRRKKKREIIRHSHNGTQPRQQANDATGDQKVNKQPEAREEQTASIAGNTSPHNGWQTQAGKEEEKGGGKQGKGTREIDSGRDR
jgi:hypothetical protein